jgi:DNA-binding response OmpR family regulator
MIEQASRTDDEILLVDDNSSSLRLLQFELQKYKFQVRLADKGSAAIEEVVRPNRTTSSPLASI